MQNMIALFDDDLVPAPGKAAVTCEGRSAVFPFVSCSGRGNVLAYWDRSFMPTDRTECTAAQILCTDMEFAEPVLVELISGKIYAVPAEKMLRMNRYTIFQDLPLADSPLVIVEKKFIFQD